MRAWCVLFARDEVWLGVRDRVSKKKVLMCRAVVEEEGFRVLIAGGDEETWGLSEAKFADRMQGYIWMDVWVPDFAVRCEWVQSVLPMKMEEAKGRWRGLGGKETMKRVWMDLVQWHE